MHQVHCTRRALEKYWLCSKIGNWDNYISIRFDGHRIRKSNFLNAFVVCLVSHVWRSTFRCRWHIFVQWLPYNILLTLTPKLVWNSIDERFVLYWIVRYIFVLFQIETNQNVSPLYGRGPSPECLCNTRFIIFAANTFDPLPRHFRIRVSPNLFFLSHGSKSRFIWCV